MIPATSEFLTLDFRKETRPSRDYMLNIEKGRINGMAEGLDAVKQAVWFILNTERYNYSIYPLSYGVELDDLYGRDKSYCIPELERRIQEALLEDDRIREVTDFTFSGEGNVVAAEFTVKTSLGDFTLKKEVNI